MSVFFSFGYFIQRIRPGPRSFVTFRNKLIFFLRWEVVSPTPKSQPGGPLLVGCPRLLIQYIRRYPLCLEAVSSNRNLRTRHAIVTRDSLNMDLSNSFCWLYSPWGPGLFSVSIYSQSVGLLGQVISWSQGLYLDTGQNKHNITTYTP
jgi:hypothetical protein